MRDGGEFLKDLRAEIAATQLRRHGHIRAKMLFVVGLVGVGVASPLTTDLSAILYLIPLVVLVFDLQILGEDFGVKRAGAFIAKCLDSPDAEKTWEKSVQKNRDAFAPWADLLGSAFVLMIAAAALWDRAHGSTTYWAWLVLNGLVVASIWKFGRLRVHSLNSYEEWLTRAYPEQEA